MAEYQTKLPLFRYSFRRCGLRWEVVYNCCTDALTRPVYGVPKVFGRLTAMGMVSALNEAHQMGAYISETYKP